MLVIEAQCGRFSTLADGSGRLQFDTRELTPDEFREVGSINKKVGVLTFHPGREGLTEKELDAIKEVNLGGALGDRKKKSRSQVLRQILYRLWQQDNEGFKTQEEHYDFYLTQIIDHFKGKLEEGS